MRILFVALFAITVCASSVQASLEMDALTVVVGQLSKNLPPESAAGKDLNCKALEQKAVAKRNSGYVMAGYYAGLAEGTLSPIWDKDTIENIVSNVFEFCENNPEGHLYALLGDLKSGSSRLPEGAEVPRNIAAMDLKDNETLQTQLYMWLLGFVQGFTDKKILALGRLTPTLDTKFATEMYFMILGLMTSQRLSVNQAMETIMVNFPR